MITRWRRGDITGRHESSAASPHFRHVGQIEVVPIVLRIAQRRGLGINGPAPRPHIRMLSAALYERFASRGEDDFATKVLAAMRLEFGGHVQRPTGG